MVPLSAGRIAAIAFLFGLSGCASAPVQKAKPASFEYAGFFYENSQESIFFPCGVSLSDEAWWVRFRDGLRADRIRYQYDGPGFPGSGHDVRVRGVLSPPQRDSVPKRFGTGFHTRELVIEDVLKSENPGSICAGYQKPRAYEGTGPVGTRIVGATVTDDRSIVAIMEHEGIVTLWRSATAELLRRFASGHGFHPSGGDARMWFNRQGTLLAEAADDGYVRVWGVPDGELRWKLAHSLGVDSLRDSTGRVIHSFGGGSVSQVAFSPDGETLASVGSGRAYTWSMSTGKVVDTLRGAGTDGLYGPYQIVSARSPTSFIGIGEDGSLHGYIVGEGRPIFSARAPGVERGQIVISPDGRSIAIRFGQDSIALWSVTQGAISHILAVPHFIGAMAYSPDSKRIAASVSTGAIFMWDVKSGRPTGSVHGLDGWPFRMWFNATGDSIVVSSPFGKALHAVPANRSAIGRFFSG